MLKQKKKLINFRPLFFSFVIFLLGIIFSFKLFSGNVLYIVLACVLLLGIIISCCLYKKFYTLILLIAMFFAGCGSGFLTEKIYLGERYTVSQNVVGRVTDNIKEENNYFRVVLEDVFVGDDGCGNLSVMIFKDDTKLVKAGDIISFNSHIDQVKLFEIGKFNSFYIRDGVTHSTEIQTSDLTIKNGDLRVDEVIRSELRTLLEDYMDDYSAGLAFAVLTGDKVILETEVNEIYKEAGIVHLLAVSGLHISFLMMLLAFLLKKCKVNKYVNFAIIFSILIFYCWVCGFTPSVLRATIMSCVFLLATLFGKEYDRLSTLSFAGFVILFINPLFAFDIGFLMSFCCVFAIFTIFDPIVKGLRKIFPSFVANALAISLSAQIGVFPFLTMIGGELNLLSVFANFVIIPIFSLLYPLLFVFVFISIIPYLGYILKLIEWGFEAILEIAKFFSSTVAYMRLQEMDFYIVLVFFLAIFVLSYFMMTKLRIKVLMISILIFLTSMFFMTEKLTIKNDNQVAVISKFGNSSYFLTDESGETLFVGNDFGALEKRFLVESNIDKVDYCLIFDGEGESSRIFDDFTIVYGVEKIVTPNVFSSLKQEEVVDVNKSKFIGNFIYEYVYLNNQSVGLCIKQNSHKFFFTTNTVLSYNEKEKLKQIGEEEFDFVFLGDKNEISSYFKKSKNRVGYYENDVNLSYANDGNFKICFEENVFYKRSLDR